MFSFMRRGRWDDERAREMQAHIELSVEELVARGISPGAARRQAIREFGNPALIKEQIYEMNSIPILETIVRDTRYALRVLRKSPAFTLTAVLTLALAIAINTAVFSVVDGVLLRALPYPHAEQLLLMEARIEASGERDRRTAQHGFAWITVRDHATTIDRAVFSTWVSGVNVVGPAGAIHADQQKIGSGFFGVLGVVPIHGREFSAEEDRRGGPPAVIVSHEFWRASLGADPAIVGRAITLGGAPHTVVGVMPPALQTGVKADLWTPLRAGTDGEGGGENYQILLRLRPGSSRAAADAELARLGSEINRLSPVPQGVTIDYGTVPLQRGLTETLRRPVLMLWVAVGIVLVMACVNLAGLLFTRGARRSREIATRMALGGSRVAIVRQLLAESVLIAVFGGATGLLLGSVALDALKGLAENALELWQPIAMDGRAVAAAALFSLAAAAAIGLAPALFATRMGVSDGLSFATARTVAAATSQRSRRIAVITQVALGVVLLIAAGLLLRTFTHLRGLDPGFDARGVYSASVSLQDARYGTSAQVNTLANSTIEQLRSAPNVEAAAVVMGLPYERLLNMGIRHMDGPDVNVRGRMINATYIAGDYFTALRIPLRAGRAFDERDTSASAPVAVVNDTMVKDYFRGMNPVGRRIAFAGATREIIGVVGDVQVKPGFGGDRGPLASMPLAYIPLAQTSDGFLRLVHGWFATSFIVRAHGSMHDVLPVMRRAVDGSDPLLPFAKVRSLDEVQNAAVALPRLLMVLLLTLAAAAVVLAGVGIHGLIAASVAERTREMGIRIALGATRARAVGTVAWPGIVLAFAGTIAGTFAARGMVSIIRSFVWGVSATDPVTFAGVAALFLAVAAAASVLPALRILRLDPAQTLRAE
jgi:putative ABC transport system permease protein